MSGPPWPGARQAWSLVLLLNLAALLSGLDRFILSLLIDPIRHDLHITDTQVSLIGGAAFAVFYGFIALPLGRIADRRNRVVLIGVGVLCWSTLTAACGLARTFGQLFLARMGVGVGEASLSGSVYSLIADLFPPERLPLAMSTYVAAGLAGSGFALVAGGWVVGIALQAGPVLVPVLGMLKPWQTSFVLAGIPGLLVGAVMFCNREPIRRNRLIPDGGKLTLRQTAQFMRSRLRVLTLHNVGFAFGALYAYSLFLWAPTFLSRTYGWSATQAGTRFGLVVLACGIPGTYFGGWLAAFLMKRGIADAVIRVAAIFFGLLVPAAIVAPRMPTATGSIVMLGVCIFVISTPVAVAQAALQLITPNDVRGQVSALFSFSNIVIGLGCGPTVIALVTDCVFQDSRLIGHSLSLVGGITATLASLLLWLCREPFRNARVSLLAERAANW